MNDIIDTYAAVDARITAAAARAHRTREEVQLIAVSKTHGPEVIADALDAGMDIFGENKVQEAAWKIPLCSSAAHWQLIGHLQSNKAKHAVRLFDTIHSVDSIKLYDAIDAAARQAGRRLEFYLEVNVSGEPSKFGLTPDAVPEVIDHVLSANSGSLTLSGMMTMAPFTTEPEKTRPFFAKLRELRERMEAQFGLELPHLSMGMSGDFEIAIEEGATDVRVGTALFGQRPKIKLSVVPDA